MILLFLQIIMTKLILLYFSDIRLELNEVKI